MSTLTKNGRCPARAFLLSALLSIAGCSLPAVGQPAGPNPCAPRGQQGKFPAARCSNLADHGGRSAQGDEQGGGPGGGPSGADQQSAGMAAASSGGITLNFVNADVRDVAKAVLGDYLKLNYEIARPTRPAWSPSRPAVRCLARRCCRLLNRPWGLRASRLSTPTEFTRSCPSPTQRSRSAPRCRPRPFGPWATEWRSCTSNT